MRFPQKIVSGAYLRPVITAEKIDGDVKLDYNGGEYWVTRHALKQIRYVLENHIEFVQSLLNNNTYEDVIEALAQVSKDMKSS
jgi:hypothetical protein